MSSGLELVIAPDDRLCTPCEPVSIDANLESLMREMLELMVMKRGIGLAAPQVGILKSFFVLNVTAEDAEGDPPAEDGFKSTGGPIFFINPKIVYRSEDAVPGVEGCLSIPGSRGEVARPSRVIVEYSDLTGDICTIKASGLLARCIQHEFDHLQGVLYIDYLSKLKQRIAKEKSAKIKKTLSASKA